MARMTTEPPEADKAERKFVSRGGFKLQAVLDAVPLPMDGAICADLGCSVGGFTDCLLQAGAAKVYAVDTAYGQLAWTLRNDERVEVHERTNAMHLEPPPPEGCRYVVIDLGWTKQDKALPVALKWLSQEDDARVITLIKPHYESGQHRLEDEAARRICREVAETLPAMGVEVVSLIEPPIRGGKGKNLEMLAVVKRID